MALLAERPDDALSLAELSRRLGVSKSTGHAILASLAAAGWVLRDPTRKTYRLGPTMVALGRQAAESFPALDFARSALVELSSEFAATCAALGVGDDAVTVLDPDTIGSHDVRMRMDLPGGAGRLYAEADGIDHVLVNGAPIVRDGALTEARNGTLLRSGRDTATPSMQ
jgi:DNA-binding IclR family transcriptional regulator